jgi:hypothetical protein
MGRRRPLDALHHGVGAGTGTLYWSIGGGSRHPCDGSNPRPCTSDLGRVVMVFYYPQGSDPGEYTRLHMTGQRSAPGYAPLAHWWRFISHRVAGLPPAWLPPGWW